MIKRFVPALLVAVVIVLAAFAASGPPAADGHQETSVANKQDAPQPGPRPNFVFILTDDLSQNIISHLPHVRALARAGVDDVPLLRGRLAVLPVPRRHLHRPVPARQRRLHQQGRRRRLRRLQPERRPAEVLRGRPAQRRLPDRADGQVPQRLRAGVRRRAGLGRVGCRGQRLSRVQLLPEHNGRERLFGGDREELPDRRAVREGRRVHRLGLHLGPAVHARDRNVRAARAVHPGAARRGRGAQGRLPEDRCLRPAAEAPAVLAEGSPAADQGPAAGDHRRLPQADRGRRCPSTR